MSLLPQKPSPLEPGYRLDRYELLCPIAQGGMASVWVARLQGKHGFEKLVAIKTILPEFTADPRFQQMFLDEARIASGIEHTNVAHILDLGEQHDILYLVMEWVDGDALSKLHRAVERAKAREGAPTPAGIWLRILADTCGGLHAAHELTDADGIGLGVVHRDVSPQNILVTSKGVAKLIDFGVAKARDRLVGETNSGNLKGKIQYMAPEQALGKPIDRRSDVWAVGAILYQLFSGKPPFEADNQLATLHLLASGRPPMPLPPEVPRPIATIVRRALSHEPHHRYATAKELQAALEEAMVEAGYPTTTQDVAAFVAKHLQERANARRDALELALTAAAERSRMANLLRPPPSDSSNGVSDGGPDVARSARALARRQLPSEPDAQTVAAPSSIDDLLAAPISETSSATLGSAAIETSHQPPVRPVRRRRTGSVVVAGALLGMAVAFAATFSRVRHTSPKTAEAARPAVVAPSLDSPPVMPRPESTPRASVDQADAAGDPSRGTPGPATSGSVIARGGIIVPARAPATTTAATRPRPLLKPAPPPPAPSAQPPKRKLVDDGF